QAGPALGRLEPVGHAGQEALDGQFLLDADHRIDRSRQSQIGQVRRSSRQDALVGRLDMGMGPDHGRDAPLEVPAHRLLLRRRPGSPNTSPMHITVTDFNGSLLLAPGEGAGATRSLAAAGATSRPPSRSIARPGFARSAFSPGRRLLQVYRAYSTARCSRITV